jgi:phosphatidate cytidylyltransferase
MRVLSAAVLGPAVLACVWFGGLAFLALAIAATAGLSVEWARLCGLRDGDRPTLALVACTVIAVTLAGQDQGAAALGVLLAGVPILFLLTEPGRRMPLLLGLPYVGLGMASLAWLRDDAEVGRADLLFLMLLVWASDIGAYMTGRVVGGPRLAPSISPNKTWSGAMGGLVVAVLVALSVCFVVQPPGSITRTVLLSAVLGMVAQAGDLFESAIKRQVGAKDSGHLIPGHGGLLDRLDALLAAAPIAALLALASGRGVVLWE